MLICPTTSYIQHLNTSHSRMTCEADSSSSKHNQQMVSSLKIPEIFNCKFDGSERCHLRVTCVVYSDSKNGTREHFREIFFLDLRRGISRHW